MPQQTKSVDLTTLNGVKLWLGKAVRDYHWNVRGIILDDGKVIPLPKEPAVVAKVIEVSVTEHFKRKAYAVPGLDLLDDLSGRGYPDVMLAGRAVDNRRIALDVKVARRKPRTSGQPTKTQSRITLGPFDSYFRRPDQPIPGVGVAYGDMAWHLDLIVLYDWIDGGVSNVEVLIVETWRVASMKRSSTTRNYIGAVDSIADLRSEQGAFDTADDFYNYWRSQPIKRVPEPIAEGGESLPDQPDDPT
jgi:restriction endonuclease EcoRV